MQMLLDQYRTGKITDAHFVVECLNTVDPDRPGDVLSGIPDSLLRRVLAFTKDYQPGRMLTNHGALPTPDQVVAARRWIEELIRQETSKSA